MNDIFIAKILDYLVRMIILTGIISNSIFVITSLIDYARDVIDSQELSGRVLFNATLLAVLIVFWRP